MIPVSKDQIHDLRNLAGFVRGAVDVEYCDRLRQGPSVDTSFANKVLIDESPGGSGVDEGLDSEPRCGVSGLELDRNNEGARTRIQAGNGGSQRDSLLPSRPTAGASRAIEGYVFL